MRHKGTTLKMSETPDIVVEVYPSVCACGADLGGTSQGVVIERRQVFDLPPQQLVVTEYRQMHGRCACCKQYWYGAFPKGVGAPVQYGPRVRALSVLLSTEYRTPLRKVGQLFKDLYGQVVNVATISGFLEDCHRRLEPIEEHIRTQLRQGTVVHFDETGIRCAGSLQWLHVASNALFTLLFVHPKRGLEAIGSSTSALVGFKGWAVLLGLTIMLGIHGGIHGRGNPLWLPLLGLTIMLGIHGGIHKGYPYGGGSFRLGYPGGGDDFQNAVEMVGHYDIFV